ECRPESIRQNLCRVDAWSGARFRRRHEAAIRAVSDENDFATRLCAGTGSHCRPCRERGAARETWRAWDNGERGRAEIQRTGRRTTPTRFISLLRGIDSVA